MKNIFIWGCGRSGKSKLAKRIGKELSYSVIHTDTIMNNYGCRNPIIWQKNDIDKRKYLIEDIDKTIKETSQPFVIEGVCLDIEHLLKEFNATDNIFICIGYPNISMLVKVFEIEKYDTDSWVRKNHPTRACKERLVYDKIKDSRIIQTIASKNNIKFFEANDYLKTQELAFEYIKNKL